jgi:hypothetical protein
VQEKLDGSNVAIAKLNGEIIALQRSGYRAETSPYLQHQIFALWVEAEQARFSDLLENGEWLSGEWLLQAHGTRYDLLHEPFVAFDLWHEGQRVTYDKFRDRMGFQVTTAWVLHRDHRSFSVDLAFKQHLDHKGSLPQWHGAIDPIEGAVWRVERNDAVDFLCKFVRQDKADGKYLPEISGNPPIWNQGVEVFLPPKAIERLGSESHD